MKIKLSILIFLCSLSFSIAQQKIESVQFFANWNQGDSYDFKISKLKKMVKDGIISKNDSATYNAKFTVLEKNPDDYKIKWTYAFDFSQFNISKEISDNLKEKLLTDIIYKTATDGEFLEILNWEEVSEKLNSMIDLIVEITVQRNSSSEVDMQNFSGQMKNVFSVKENVESLAAKEVMLLHNVYGGEFTVGDTIEYAESRPNPFGGNPIQVNNFLYVQKSNKENEVFKVIIESTIDSSESKIFVSNIVKTMNLKDDEFDKFINNSIFEINESNSIEYSTKLSMPIKIETNRNSIIKLGEENGSGKDILTIELIKNKK